MFKQPEPVKLSEDEELESDEDEGETEGGEEDGDDSDNDDEQAEEGVENDNEEDDQDENDQEDEDNQQDDGEQEDKDEEDDDDDDDDDDEAVEDKREPPSKEVKALGGQQRMAKGAQQPVKEVKEKTGKANNDAAKQGQQTADIVAKQARQESLGDLAGVSSDVMTAAPDQPSQTGDKAHEAKKDAKNAASGTTEQAEKTSKTSEGKKEGQDGDPFSGLEMTTHFPKSTSANDVWVNVTSTAERTSVTIRIPGK